MSRSILAAGAAALALGSAAFAQANNAAKPITRSEFLSRADTAFHNLDTNHDGSISVAEVQADVARTVQQLQAAVRAKVEAQFKALDTNHDGQLSLAEFAATAPQVKTNATPQQVLQQLDTNHDGKISPDEFKAPRMAAFNRADTNHDGVLSVQEQAAARQRK